MKTLDDKILFIFHLIERQSYFQKLDVFNTLSEKQNYILIEDMVLFLPNRKRLMKFSAISDSS